MPVSGIEKLVCEDVEDRQALGIAKYGTTVADNPLTLLEWMQHEYEEQLDALIYKRRQIEEVRSWFKGQAVPPFPKLEGGEA